MLRCLSRFDLQAIIAYVVGMKNRQIQYTLRKIPPHIDRELRERADRERKSLNAVALQVLEQGLGLTDLPIRHHDLDDLVGTWVEDPEFDRVIEEMDQVDTQLWQ